LKYLAPYIFRVAISNNRILKLENDRVTFRYRDTDSGQERRCTLEAEEFIHRFLQHVLPRNFVKVRYYGLFSPSFRKLLSALRKQLEATLSLSSSREESLPSHDPHAELTPSHHTIRCPICGCPMLPGPLIPAFGLSPP